MKIAIVKYNAGNIQSVSFCLNRLGISPVITDNPEELQTADKVIFPGVGEASTAMKYLREQNLDKLIVSLKQPVLGICLGMQLMCKSSEENTTECLNIFDVDVKKFPETKKVPHMGWNTIFNFKSELFKGISENDFMYFVHSFYAPDSEYAICTTDYNFGYSSGLHKDNFYGLQFHPEKSGKAGEKIIENFINL